MHHAKACTHREFTNPSHSHRHVPLQEGENTLNIAQLRACQGRSYSCPIKLTQEILVQEVHCNVLHPGLDPGDQAIIWMMTCAPLIFHEVLKLLLEEGMAKLCPIDIVPREYEALQFCLVSGEPRTPGHYLLVGLSTLSGAHMLLLDILLFQPDFLLEATPLVQPWHEPPFFAPSSSDIMDTPREQRTPGEMATYLNGRFCPKPQQGKRPKELRWVTTCLTPDPTEDSAPKYADWEACASLFVVIDILTHADGIRHSGFEGEPKETARGLLVLVA